MSVFLSNMASWARRSSALLSPWSSTTAKLSLRGFSSSASITTELGFAFVTPKSLAKSLEGCIIARLLSKPGITMVASRMYAPSDRLVSEMSRIYSTFREPPTHDDEYLDAMLKFFEQDLRLDNALENGYPNHILLLMFRGERARELIAETVGHHFTNPAGFGRSIRGSFGDYYRVSGKIHRFQPAVVTFSHEKGNREMLKLFAEYAETDGGVVSNWWELHNPDTDGDGVIVPHETSLVMIKPDRLTKPSSLPGHIIDMLGTTGLHLIGSRVLQMSLDQASEFYGFLEKIFEKKFAPDIERILKEKLQQSLEFPLTPEIISNMTKILQKPYATEETNQIVQYMTGHCPRIMTTAEERKIPGPAKVFALLYRGENAISEIRNKLGSTDPSKAAHGTIRSDYGTDVMRNSAHASDSAQSVDRERKIIGLVGNEPSGEKRLIEQWLSTGEVPI